MISSDFYLLLYSLHKSTDLKLDVPDIFIVSSSVGIYKLPILTFVLYIIEYAYWLPVNLIFIKPLFV